ncbi:helix-turn-helix domain-containing protein [Saccharothrix sp. AJ9571]|nr:helix-turn-helix domain-containing protein [Saccharothrix sp. AJ9571]
MKIAVHAFDGITTFHLAAPLLVFDEVSRQGLATDWSTTVWSADGRSIRTSEGLVVDGLGSPAVASAADLVVFPSWPTDLPPPREELVEVVRAAHGRGAGVVGLCLGAFPVASAGLLDGRSAATHWAAAARLAAGHPEVAVQSSALYVDHGDVLTSAGTASALDACLHIVRQRLGAAAATTVARHLVIAPHREGDQAQYIERPLAGHAGATDPIGTTLEWAAANLHLPLSVEDLAGHARMSTRNFVRRFRETTGTSPARWVTARRLDEARRLLEVTAWTVARIAETCGYDSVVTFRQNFVRAYATTPTSYRQRFAGLVSS